MPAIWGILSSVWANAHLRSIHFRSLVAYVAHCFSSGHTLDQFAVQLLEFTRYRRASLKKRISIAGLKRRL